MTTTLTRRPPDRLQADGRCETQNTTATSSARVGDPPPPRVDDGAISDARHHARRRRIRLGIALVATAGLLGVGLLMAFDGAGGPSSGMLEAADASGPGVPPVGDAEKVVAAWSGIHAGWVFVYEDGRVLVSDDGRVPFVMRLSGHGLELVQSGAVQPDEFVTSPWMIPTSAWLDTDARPYRAEHYAVCRSPGDEGSPGTPLGDVSGMEARLPGDLAGIVSATTVSMSTGPFGEGLAPGPGAGTTCWMLDAPAANRLWAYTRPLEDGSALQYGGRVVDGAGSAWGRLDATDGSTLELVALPVLPHGGVVLWGG